VLSKEEVLAVIGNLPGTYQLVAKMLYGTGLRLAEVLQLRVKDIDFAHCQIVVRDTKGMKQPWLLCCSYRFYLPAFNTCSAVSFNPGKIGEMMV
jgi:integrase